jgi:hypothetical protein
MRNSGVDSWFIFPPYAVDLCKTFAYNIPHTGKKMLKTFQKNNTVLYLWKHCRLFLSKVKFWFLPAVLHLCPHYVTQWITWLPLHKQNQFPHIVQLDQLKRPASRRSAAGSLRTCKNGAICRVLLPALGGRHRRKGGEWASQQVSMLSGRGLASPPLLYPPPGLPSVLLLLLLLPSFPIHVTTEPGGGGGGDR